MLVGLCRRAAVVNVDVATDSEIEEQLRCDKVALDACNGVAWSEAMKLRQSLEDLKVVLESEKKKRCEICLAAHAKNVAIDENKPELRNELAVDDPPGEYFESDAAVKNEIVEDSFKNISKVKTELDIREPSITGEPLKEDNKLDVKEVKLEIEEETLSLSNVKMEIIDGECYSELKNPALKAELEEEKYKMKQL